jgi:hypothetical protein
METIDTAARTADGRFAPGHSGNPAGKPWSAKNRATVLRESLRDGEECALARVVVEKALKGNAMLARFLLTNLYPALGRRTIELVPEGGEANVAAILDGALGGMARGEISIGEVAKVQSVVANDMRMRGELKARTRVAEREPEMSAERPSPSRGLRPGHRTASRFDPSPAPRERSEGAVAAREEGDEVGRLKSPCISPTAAAGGAPALRRLHAALLNSTCNTERLPRDTSVDRADIQARVEKLLTAAAVAAKERRSA